MNDEELSRQLNAFTGGDPSEMFSVRLYRNVWTRWFWLALPLMIYTDWRCHKRYGEPFPGHCRRSALKEANRLAREPDPLTRAMDVT